MFIYCGKKLNKDTVAPLQINGDLIQRVQSFKLLGVIFSSDLSWGQHVSYILQKISKRYHLIFELARIRIPCHEIIQIYCAIIRSVLEYACAVWHSGLTAAQSQDIERVQMRCLRIIFPELKYDDALLKSGLDRLSVRRETIVQETFREIQLPNHVLHNLLPIRPDHNFNFGNSYPYAVPAPRTNRYSNSFIPYCIRKLY